MEKKSTKSGYRPSDSVKKRIAAWEGSAMTGAIDPLSGKWGKNRSFEEEANSFYHALPADIREQVISNPGLADNLFSYSYNVGAGRFKERVVPALRKYYAGKGSAEEVASSMWASGDKKLRGLRNRRAVERQGVVDSLAPSPVQPVFDMPADNTFVFNPFPIHAESTTVTPIMVPDTYVEAHRLTPSEDRVNRFQEAMEARRQYNNLMDAISIQNNPAPQYTPQNNPINAPYVVAPYDKGGYLRKSWNDLSMSEKAEMMKVAVRNGITNLQDIRDKYNEFAEGGSVVEAAMNEYRNGGKIHIKPENRGKFTALKERTGHSASWFKEHGTPAQKKMAVFALNARKWKHEDGGNLYKGGGVVGMPALPGISLREAIAKRLYNTTDALDGYDVGEFVTSVVTGNSSNNLKNTREHLKFKLSQDPSDNDITRRWKGELNQTDIADELYAQYLGIPVEDRHTKVRLSKSPYRSGSYRMPITNAEWDKIISETDDLNVGENTSTGVFRTAGLNTSAIGKGHDEKGEYRSYGDSFDLNPFRGSAATKDIPGINKINDLSLGLFNPVEVYDRVYLDDYYGVPKEDRGGNYLPEIVITGRKKKKSFGGNLFDGNSQPTQKMQIGLNVQGWPNYTTEQIIAYGEENERRREALENAYLNFVTESNDATAVANGRPQNKHLEERGIRGAKAHAAWEKEHPVATQWGNVLGAVPFAVAAYPLAATAGSGVVALGDAAAATSAGQAITAGLAPLATAASTSVAGAPLYTWADVGLSSLFGAHGIQTAIDEGGISPTTALELLPVTRVVNPAVEMGYNAAKPAIDYSQQAIKNYQVGRAMKLQPKNMPKVNKEFRSEEWGNFLNTRNGDNYYRIANIEKETANGYSPKENYFVSHTTPWEEFSGMKGIEDPAMIGKNLPTFHNRLYEFPSKTFGTRKSSSWEGVLGDTNVDVMGKNHLYYGDTSSGVRGPVRVISDTNADYLGISPYKIGIKDRPLTINGLYDKTPVYEDIYMGNQTVLNGKELQEAIQNSTYNIFDHTPLFFMGKDATPSGITKIIHINR